MDEVNQNPDPASEEARKTDELPQDPLAVLGLGPKWLPGPSDYKWAKINTPEGPPIHVLRVFTVGGSMGIAMTTEQLVAFAAAAQAEAAKAMAAAGPRLVVPGGANRAQRRHPDGRLPGP